MEMLMEPKEKLDNAIKRKNEGKESTGSDGGGAKEMVQNKKQDPPISGRWKHTPACLRILKDGQKSKQRCIGSWWKWEGITPLRENHIPNGWRGSRSQRNSDDLTYTHSTKLGQLYKTYGIFL